MQPAAAEATQTPTLRRSLVLSFAQNYTSLLITIPTVMIISRLLTPAEVGIYSVAAAFVMLAHQMRDFGVSEYLVQAEVLDDAVARSAFTINLLIACTLALCVFAISGSVATFYNEPALEQILKIISINFLLLPFGSTVDALLKRSFQFGIRYKISLLSRITQSFSTIALAYLGYSYLGLAWGSVAGVTATVIGCAVWGRLYSIRGVGLSHWRSVTNFGAQRSAANVMKEIGFSAPDFIIGRLLDFTAVGLYSRGNGLLNLFRQHVLRAIGAVAFPAYARDERQTNNGHILLLKSLTFATGFSWPFLCCVALMAFPIMRIMFGDQWDAAVPILQLLAVAALFVVVAMQCQLFFTAIGRPALVTKTTAIVECIRIVLLVITAFIGLLAIAAAQILVGALQAALCYYFLLGHTRVAGRDFAKALRPSLIVTAMTLVPCLTVVWVWPPAEGNVWLSLLLGGPAALTGWAIGLAVTSHPLGKEIASWLPTIYGRVRRLIA